MEQATTWFLTQGVLGVLCVVLFLTVGYLWRENNRLRDKMFDKSMETLEKVTNALNENSHTSRLLSEKIESAKRGDG